MIDLSQIESMGSVGGELVSLAGLSDKSRSTQPVEGASQDGVLRVDTGGGSTVSDRLQ